MNKLEETRRNRKNSKKHISFAAFKAHVSKTGMKSASIALSLVMLVSSLPVISLTAFADEPNNSQTKYADINDYQNARIAEIQKEIFKTPTTKAGKEAYNQTLGLATPKPMDNNDREKLLSRWEVNDNNEYFNWNKNTGPVKWENPKQNYKIGTFDDPDADGTDFASMKFLRKKGTYDALKPSQLPVVTMKVTDAGEEQNLEFIVFNVTNPYQLRYAMEFVSKLDNCDDYPSGTSDERTESKARAKFIQQNFMINITADLDMMGYTVNENTAQHETKTEQYYVNNPNFDKEKPANDTTNPRDIFEKYPAHDTSSVNNTNDWQTIDFIQPASAHHNTQVGISPGDVRSRVIYIEGNGHTMYNLRTSDRGFIGVANTNLIIKNFGMSNSMVIHSCDAQDRTDQKYTTSLVASHGTNATYMHLYNVHTKDSYVQGYNEAYVSGLFGRKVKHTGLFIENCSSSGNIVIGGQHVGGLTANIQAYNTSTTAVDGLHVQQTADIKYNDPFSEKDGNDNTTRTPDGIILANLGLDNTIKEKFPSVIQNSYSVDSELFSFGADSGALISCGIGMVVKNCYTNNNIYSDTNTGGFIGRVSSRLGIYSMKDDAKAYKITNYFENCYSSGIVEGRNGMGGFIGFVQGLRNIVESYKINPFMDNNAISHNSHTGRTALTSFVSGHDDSKNNKYVYSLRDNSGSTVFYNCYSSASVGMDYAGRYCGGFAGMDQSYSIGTTVSVNGEPKIFNGNAYINCYATGEVGNILTVTDDERAADLEKYYLADTKNGEGEDNAAGKGGNKDVEILDYYPTGGFIGVLAPDRWWVAVAGNYKNTSYAYFTPNSLAEQSINGDASRNLEDYKVYNKAFGYFNNCYYDMQTTAMREMAVGVAGGENAYIPDNAIKYETGEPDKGKQTNNYTGVDFTFGTCDGKTEGGKAIAYQQDIDAARRGQTLQANDGKIAQYSLAGVTGLYTTTAEEKGIMGLTNMTATSDLKMEASGDDWRYEHGYYPQLAVFSDSNVESTEEDQQKSVFWIKDNNGLVSGNLPADQTLKGNNTITLNGERACEGSTFQNKTMIMRAYRYSQASTAAVVLNNYNFIMDADGSLMSDKDWAVAQENNKMTLNEESGFYQVGYKGLNAGTYEFKVQANDSMTYNYGATKFDDPTNCKLEINGSDGQDVVIRFKYNELFSNDFQIYADFYDSNGFEYDKETNTYRGKILRSEKLGGNDNEIKYSVIGSFTNSWQDDIFLDATDFSHKNFETIIDFTENMIKDAEGNPVKHEFKVRGNQDWNVANFGYDGVSDGTNMSFKLTEPRKVKITFSSETHKCGLYIQKGDNWISADDESMLKICPESYIADNTDYHYDSYTVVSDKAVITKGRRWSDTQTIADKKEVAALGKMTSLDGGKTYTYTAENVPTGANYQLRVLKYDTENNWALDNSDNCFFNIAMSAGAEDETCTLTVTYDTETGKVSYKAVKTESGDELKVEEKIITDLYVVAGDEKITGFHWLGSDKTKIPAADPDAGPTDKEIQDYKTAAIDKGRMKEDTGTSNNIYTWTSDGNIPAGTYTFKIFAAGDIDLGFGEHGGTSNMSFTLEKDAPITIRFNADNHMSSIECPVPGSLKITQYVVTGTENLMGDGQVWNLYNGVMQYDINTGLYTYIISKGEDKEPIPASANYAFKVIEYGKDSGSNISFYLNKPSYIKVTYDPITATTSYATYSDPACEQPNEANEAVHISMYAVIGEKGLTGYTWLGLQENGQPYSGEEKKKMEADATKAGRLDQVKDNPNLYTKTFEHVEVGTGGNFKSYAFKIAANGNWDSGISYGNGDGNYIITLANPDTNAQEGSMYYNYCNVTITFDAALAAENKPCIKVKTTPENYLMGTINTEKFVWYVVGDQGLASYTDSFRGPDTTYDTVRDITQTINFTNGADTEEKGVAWAIDTEKNLAEDYINKFGGSTTNPNAKSGFTLNYHVDGKDVQATFDEDVVDLDTRVDYGNALKKEEMATPIDDDGVDANLENYLDVDNLLSNVWKNPAAYVNFPITYTSERFMPGKQFITVSTYGVGTNEKFNKWKRIRVLYDQLTLRGKDLDKKANTLIWLIDANDLKNADPDGSVIQQLTAYLQQMKDADKSQYLHYTEGFDFLEKYKQWTRLHTELQNYKNGAAGYEGYSDQFINDPGDSQKGTDVIPLDAPYVDEVSATVIGSRLVRLIPKGYIEAGNDATVTVIDDMEKNIEKRQNVVLYEPDNSTPDVQGKFTDGKSLDTQTFSYYNFALMAGYAITDKIGLGIFDNYNNQGTTDGNYGIKPYDATGRDEDDKDNRAPGKYYAMTSAFNETANYTDESGAAENPQERNTNLEVGKLVSQKLIGDSSEKTVSAPDGTSAPRSGQTIVKIYQVLNKGKSTESERIIFTKQSDSESAESDSNKNYQKWTGNQLFESSDDGDYRVKFYWAMNDGRYFIDSKDVKILANISGIVKSVDKSFDDATYNTATNELTYTLKYTNSVSAQPVTFAILDILPFVGDERINRQMEDTAGGTVDVPNDKTSLADSSGGAERLTPDFSVEKIEITREGNQNTKKAEIKGVYVTSSANIQDLMYEDATNPDNNEQIKVPIDDAASKLGVYVAPNDLNEFMESTDPAQKDYVKKVGTINLDSGNPYVWNKLERPQGTGTDGIYTFKEGSDNAKYSQNVKAVAVTGIQLASADSVTVDITLKFNGNPNDDLFNNSYFFSAFGGKWQNDEIIDYEQNNGYSNNVRTTIVGRDLSGIVWLDSNVNGIYDEGEPTIENVAVNLVKLTKGADGNVTTDIVHTINTDGKGAYNFSDNYLGDGSYKVEFAKPTDNIVTLHYKNEAGEDTTVTKKFSELFISKIISETNGVDNNISKIGTGDDKGKYYINEDFPTAGDIFTYSYSDAVNVVKNNFVYTKSRQNLALTDAYGSIKIEKYKDNDKKQPMSGVKFKIEYQDGDDWKPLVYNTDGFIDSPDSTNLDPDRNTGEYTTDAKGTISVDKLLQTTYRITEIELPTTPEGAKDPNPLIKPIYITIPYELAKGEKPDSNSIVSVSGDPDTKGDKDYYRDVKITLSNTTELNDYLPLTGSTEGFNYWIPIAGLIFVIIGAGVILYAVKRRKAKKSGCK